MNRLQILILFLSISAISFAQKTITMQIKENTLPCTGTAPMDCLQVMEGGATTWSNFYSSIEGFDYQPGYLYTLKVRRTKLKKPVPGDAPAYTYRLKRIVCKKQVQTQSSGYLGKKMILTQMNGENISNGKAYLTIDSTKNKIFGKSGCNNFNAGYNLSGNKIEVSMIMGTMKACDTESMQLEQHFKTAMEKKGFEIHTTGQTVHFNDLNTKQVVLAFNIPTKEDIWTFIDGKKWKLFQLDNIGKDYGRAAIQFDLKNKKVHGNSGCNNFFGSYTTNDDQISFSALGGTKMACLNEEDGETEKKILNYLSNSSIRFDIAEQTLNFYKGNKLVMMFGIQQ